MTAGKEVKLHKAAARAAQEVWMEMLLLKQLIQSEEKIPSAADSLEAEHGVPTCQEGLTSLFSDKTDAH